MNVFFAEKLKELRTERKVSQEKLAQYLNISFQAVSKWENGNAYPDITLLPNIARFFGVSVDELLCVERIDEDRLYKEYEEKADELYRNGKISEALTLWQEAYKRMPNNIDVKEMLMSAYFDTDIEKYFTEFYDLAMDILKNNEDGQTCAMYYKGQAISQLACIYAKRGDKDEALKWAGKSIPLFNSKEMIESRIDTGDDLIEDVSFCTFWFLEELFCQACRIDSDDSITLGDDYKQRIFETVAEIYEAVYKNDDMGFEKLQHLCNLHQGIAEREAIKRGDESVIKYHLQRAFECCEKSMTVKAHTLKHPLLYGWPVSDAPIDNKLNMRYLSERIEREIYNPYRSLDWFAKIQTRITEIMEK